MVVRLSQPSSVLPDAVGEAIVSFPGTEQDFTARAEQRAVALHIRDLPGRRLTVEGHQPEPALAFPVGSFHDSLPPVRRDIEGRCGEARLSSNGKARQQWFVKAGI